MKTNHNHIEDYLEQPRPSFASSLRTQAETDLREYGFPALKTESWKYTNAKALLRNVFQPAQTCKIPAEKIQTHFVENTNRLVFVNGILDESLSDYADCTASIQPISSANELLGSVVTSKQTGFTALNSVLYEHGYFIEVTETLSKPLHVLHVATDLSADNVIYNKNLLVLKQNATAQVLEHFISLQESAYWRNSVTEVVLEQNTDLHYYKLQQEAESAQHTHFMATQQAEGSQFTSFNIDLGGGLVRNDLHASLLEQQARCDLQGVYLLREQQHVDNHTVINHQHAFTYSNEHYKGILQDKARAVFNGRVFVEQDAQKIDSQQKNANLLLSADCEIDTKPELEIYADDVKCAHGATVGQLNKEAVFFLQARGLSEEMAQKMLTFGFAYEIVEAISETIIHDVCKQALLNWFSSDAVLQELLQ